MYNDNAARFDLLSAVRNCFCIHSLILINRLGTRICLLFGGEESELAVLSDGIDAESLGVSICVCFDAPGKCIHLGHFEIGILAIEIRVAQGINFRSFSRSQ